VDPKIGEKVVGESHAWVEWWAGSWFAFDPTNDVDVSDRHVVVGRGRDYDDVPPLRGVYAGPFNSELFVTVEITKEG
jgi:transglutaminase-like putative cysteine protease